MTKILHSGLFSFSSKGRNKSYFLIISDQKLQDSPESHSGKNFRWIFHVSYPRFCGSFFCLPQISAFFFGSPWITCGRYGMLLVAFALLLSLTLALQEPGSHKSLHKEGVWGLLICWWRYPPSYIWITTNHIRIPRSTKDINQQHQPTASTIQDIMTGKVTVGYFVFTTEFWNTGRMFVIPGLKSGWKIRRTFFNGETGMSMVLRINRL